MWLPPPYKSLIYNALCSAGCFLARRELYSLKTPSDSPSMGRTLSSRTTFYSHTENTNFTDSRGFFRSHADAAENAEAHLLSLVLASGMYAFGAADWLRAFAMQPILRSLRLCVPPKTLREKKQFKFSLNSVDKMKTTDYADYSD